LAEREIRRLVIWNRLWLAGLILVSVWYGAARLIASAQASLYQLRPSWDGEVLRLTAPSDGPFVVTHLVNRSNQSTAPLPHPLGYIESHGVYITGDEYKKLEWRSMYGEKIAGPPVGAKVTALYYRPLEARWRDEPP
jgi:hypothetical protein